jgi:hypothetical protein
VDLSSLLNNKFNSHAPRKYVGIRRGGSKTKMAAGRHFGNNCFFVGFFGLFFLDEEFIFDVVLKF